MKIQSENKLVWHCRQSFGFSTATVPGHELPNF